jgi:hypothetical protein
VRSSASTDGKIVRKVTSGTVVAINTPTKGNWAELQVEEGSSAKQYIHTSRLQKVDKWKHLDIGPRATLTGATLKRDGLEVSVSSKPFKASEHKVHKPKEGLATVDGKNPWGCDGTIPRDTLLLSISLHGKALKLPAEAVANLYEPNFDTLSVHTPSTADKHCFVAMLNGDGAGAYSVIWAFVNGTYVGRAVFVPF